MTRQEAIKILKSKMDGSVDTSYEWAEAVRMAIEALKIQDESKTKNIIYDFLIAKLGEDIMNNPFKFEDWFNRMVWHVQECYKLNKKLLMNTGDYDLISRQDYGANMRGHIEVLNEIKSGYISDCGNCGGGDKSHCGDFCFDFSAIQALNLAIKALEQEPCDDMGEVSDGYHTFNQLYHQRAVLFATIVNQNKDKSWKSFRHSDGNYCFDSNGEWFIVGIDTPQGSYTYHYSKEYWNMFDCEELEFGKEWDGHTDEDVTRLLSLEQEPSEDCISREWLLNAFGLSEKTRKYGGDHSGYDTLMLYEIQDVIEDAPSVEPSRATGKWIAIDDTHSQCVECGATFCITSSNEWEVNYCPNCGARVEVEEE